MLTHYFPFGIISSWKRRLGETFRDTNSSSPDRHDLASILFWFFKFRLFFSLALSINIDVSIKLTGSPVLLPGLLYAQLNN